jgi:hypothetical protein
MTRVVLLGASNLVLGFPLIVKLLSAGVPRPLEIFAASGHGRSYCGWSRVLFRGLPGIDACGLWEALARSNGEGPTQTLALITDVGNDLIYGTSVDVIARRIESCLTRLAEHKAAIVVTHLPLASIERLSALRFHTTRALFFPRTRGSWPGMLDTARELDARVVEVGSRAGAVLINQPRDWYGFDPIHIRQTRRQAAWRTIFCGWPAFNATTSLTRRSPSHAVRLRLAPPAERSFFGRVRRRPQPAIILNDVPIRLY